MNGAIHYKDFIGIYENVYPDGFCRHVIEEFERLSNEGVTGNRQLSEQCDKTQKQDEFVFLNFKNQAGTPFKVEIWSFNRSLHGFRDALSVVPSDKSNELVSGKSVVITGLFTGNGPTHEDAYLEMVSNSEKYFTRQMNNYLISGGVIQGNGKLYKYKRFLQERASL